MVSERRQARANAVGSGQAVYEKAARNALPCLKHSRVICFYDRKKPTNRKENDMKKPILLLLALLLALLPLTVSHSSAQDPPVVVRIDNETPFVYRSAPESAVSYDRYVNYDAMSYIASFEGVSYNRYAAMLGNPPIRHFQSDTAEHFYTVVSTYDNCLLYVFLEPAWNGEFCFQEYGVSKFDIRANPHRLREYVFEYDLPVAILGDALPPYCKLEYYTAEEIERKAEFQWSWYHECCSQASLESYGEEFFGEEYCSYYRCVQYVSFDVIEGRIAFSGLHNYDVLCRTDGTGKLIYRHFLYSESGLYATLHSEQTRELSATEMDEWNALLREVDFCNIPTWNPEEIRGFDGETTFFYGSATVSIASAPRWSGSSSRNPQAVPVYKRIVSIFPRKDIFHDKRPNCIGLLQSVRRARLDPRASPHRQSGKSAGSKAYDLYRIFGQKRAIRHALLQRGKCRVARGLFRV